MSAEPGRRKAYSSDIRWRIIYQRVGMGLTFPDIARRLNIALSTAHRIFSIFECNGTVEPATRNTCRLQMRVLDQPGELYVIGLILHSPTLYLGEIVKLIKDNLGVDLSAATICRLLKRYGHTRKKVRQVAQQRCAALRGHFMAHISLYTCESFVWIDETGSNKKDHIRKYGYALRGVTPVYHRLLCRGERYNAIAAISCTDVLALEVRKGSINGTLFYDFLRGELFPKMQTFPGPNSVAIMDNCSIHHVQEVHDLAKQLGIVLFYLPPYSPDYNPIEESFSYVKSYLRKHDELLQSIPNPTCIIKAAFDSITSDHLMSWVSHAGYNVAK